MRSKNLNFSSDFEDYPLFFLYLALEIEEVKKNIGAKKAPRHTDYRILTPFTVSSLYSKQFWFSWQGEQGKLRAETLYFPIIDPFRRFSQTSDETFQTIHICDCIKTTHFSPKYW